MISINFYVMVDENTPIICVASDVKRDVINEVDSYLMKHPIRIGWYKYFRLSDITESNYHLNGAVGKASLSSNDESDIALGKCYAYAKCMRKLHKKRAKLFAELAKDIPVKEFREYALNRSEFYNSIAELYNNSLKLGTVREDYINKVSKFDTEYTENYMFM